MSQPTQEERLSALENQCYIMYLQLNALTKLLLDKEILSQEIVTKEMDNLNTEIVKVTKGLIEKAEAEEAPSAVPAE